MKTHKLLLIALLVFSKPIISYGASTAQMCDVIADQMLIEINYLSKLGDPNFIPNKTEEKAYRNLVLNDCAAAPKSETLETYNEIIEFRKTNSK